MKISTCINMPFLQRMDTQNEITYSYSQNALSNLFVQTAATLWRQFLIPEHLISTPSHPELWCGNIIFNI